MKITWLGIVSLIPLLAACNSGAIDISSSSVSKEQLDTIANNINQKYPDAPDWLKQKAAEAAVREIENLVFVKGGTFEMGDFRAPCEIPSRTNKRMDWTPEAKCLSSIVSSQTGSKYLHTVTLDDYSISKHRTRFSDLESMRKLNKLPISMDTIQYVNGKWNHEKIDRESDEYKETINTYKNSFALTIDWKQANKYCTWLKDITNLPFSLPTEAQWEFAARSRGKKLYYPTNNGYLQHTEDQYFDKNQGIYIEYKEEDANNKRSSTRYGLFSPNPLGIYDMTSSFPEWVNDWYSEDYYTSSPKVNPRGPDSGLTKVLRGKGMTFTRLKGDIEFYVASFRCSTSS